MSNARIQFSTAEETKWAAINPQLREGELVLAKKPNGKYKLVVGGPGGSAYLDSTLVWDQEEAEALTTRSENAQTTAVQKAQEIVSAATNANTANSGAQNAMNEAVKALNATQSLKNATEQAKNAAVAAQGKAETANSEVQAAKTEVLNAKDEAVAAAANAMTNTPEGWTQAVATLEAFKALGLYKDEDGDVCQND